MNAPSKLQFERNVDLSSYSGIRVGGKSAWHVVITEPEQIQELSHITKTDSRFKNIKIVPVGSGTNTFYGSGKLNLLSIENKLFGKQIIDQGDNTVTIKIASGENWDEIVAWTVQNGWAGIEALSAIPGTVGAAPVQNIGAYGQEVSETLQTVTVYNFVTNRWQTLTNKQCEFSYRNSIFKRNPGQYFITEITLVLQKNDHPGVPSYDSVQGYFKDNPNPSVSDIRQAVSEVRWSKLPKPDILPNCGSWFKNPIVDQKIYYGFLQNISELGFNIDQVPHWEVGNDLVKLSAGWLVEQTVGKDYCDDHFCTYGKNALVIINPTLSPSTKKLLKFEKLITDAVNNKFGIQLEREPILIE